MPLRLPTKQPRQMLRLYSTGIPELLARPCSGHATKPGAHTLPLSRRIQTHTRRDRQSGPRAARFPTDAAFEAWLATIFEEGALRWLADQHMPREHLIWIPDNRHLTTHPDRRDAYYDRGINQVDGSSS